MSGDYYAVEAYGPRIVHYARLNGLLPSIVAGLIDVESGGQPGATSPDNGPGLGPARGLMQILGGEFSSGEDPYDVETNLRVGCALLAAKTAAYGGRLESGLAAYFGAVDSAGNPTGGSDLTGTTGIQYVAEVIGASHRFAALDELVDTTGAAAVVVEVDPSYRQYAPRSGTWREAAINLKGIADQALARGRSVASAASAAAVLWGGL